MITATVKAFNQFSRVSEDLLRLSAAALDEAALVAAETAQAAATIDLQIETIPAVLIADHVTSGIVSKKEGRKENVRIAHFFDQGTLAGHRGTLKRPGRSSWSVRRTGGSYTATRHAIQPGEGIEAQGFFGKGRSAGRRALTARIERGAAAAAFFGR